MPNSDVKSIKIVRGSEKQLSRMNQALEDDDFSNFMILNSCIINDVYREYRRIEHSNGKTKAHEFLKNLVVDNFADLDKKEFFKNPRGMGKLG